MFGTSRYRIKLYSRNEGKLKSYGSCTDARAWSHDDNKRNSYLQDWIRCDMPKRALPECKIANFSNSMTRKHRTGITPRCHSECRSKVILDNIYTSCHAIKECLRAQGEFNKFFDEEEFETSHWPCEKCVEILRNIKLFWNIILEKIFKINVPTSKEFECSTPKSVCEFAKEWKDEIVKQTLLVKKISPLLSKHFGINQEESVNYKQTNQQNKHSKDKCHQCDKTDKTCIDKATTTDSVTNVLKIKNNERNSKHSSAFVEKSDVSSNTLSIEDFIRKDLFELQQKLSNLNSQIECLKSENVSLKMKVKNSSKEISSYNYGSAMIPVDCCCTKKSELIKEITSEMIITLKKCGNEEFHNVSIIQIVHKSNGTLGNDENCYGLNDKNPLKILTRVYDTFGTIVGREMNIAKENNCSLNEIKTSFYKI